MSARVLRSLARRSPAELADRTRQALGKALERRGIGDTAEPTSEVLGRLVDLSGIGSGPVIRGPFFASVHDREATLVALTRLDPGFTERLRQRANRVAGGHFDLLGHRALTFGDPPDWWLDPVAGVRAPARHWSEIDYLDPAVAGDHKVIWELSRHQGLLTLAQAYWCTREPAYLEVLSALLSHWLDSNRPKLGINWASSLEVSFRGITWLWILALAGESMDRSLVVRMMGALAISARHIQRYLSRWFSPNTHLTGEALGLFMLGTALPQCAGAAEWRARGQEILLDWLVRHVRPDGTYVEQSTWYHRYTTDFYLHFATMAQQSGLDVHARVDDHLGRLLDYLCWIARPDGSMPLIGDDDGGRLLFLDERTAHDARTPMAIGAVLLRRPDLAFHAGQPSPELIWLLGPGAVRDFEELRAAASPPARLRTAFPLGGSYVLRSGWNAADSVMTIDAGPHGFLNGGHAHADALSLDFCLEGQPLFVDPGTFTYTTSPEWRDAFRLSAAHCAAVVDGCGSATPSGPFRWQSRAEGRCLAWHDTDSVALFAGTHDGFDRLQPPVQYTRNVAFIAPDLWIVRDELEGDDEHELAIHWQCAPGIQPRLADSGGVELQAGGAVIAGMRVAEPDGTWHVSSGWVSPAYGTRVPAAHVHFVRRARGAVAVTTVIAPRTQLRAVVPGDAPGNAPPTEITWGNRRGTLVTRAGVPDWLETDAQVAWVEHLANGAPPVVTATSGQPVVHAERYSTARARRTY